MASYRVEVARQAQREIRSLPGNIRQRVIRALRDLASEPQPHNSKVLDITSLALPLRPNTTVRRIRMDTWRIVYLVEEDARLITVLGVRKRPPYNYQDLRDLLS